jgi:hypothetical protein
VSATARCLIVAITICSWIAISNHCALGLTASLERATKNECPFHSHSQKPAKQKDSAPCCKILRAITTAPAKGLSPAIVDLVNVGLALDAVAGLGPPKISLTPATLGTGPPGQTSLAELIRSMRAHAPPFSV